MSHRVRVTAAESEQLRALAAARELSVPRLLVESALSATSVIGAERKEVFAALFRIRRTLTGIGTNLNQLAAQANATGSFVEDAETLVPDIRVLCRRVDDVIDQLAGIR